MPDKELKITVPMLYLLLTLVDAPAHGYAMGQEVARRSRGRVELGPASLYWSINRLREAGLIREVDVPDEGDGRGRPRRYYEPTDAGLAALREEVEVLEDAVAFAREVATGSGESR